MNWIQLLSVILWTNYLSIAYIDIDIGIEGKTVDSRIMFCQLDFQFCKEAIKKDETTHRERKENILPANILRKLQSDRKGKKENLSDCCNKTEFLSEDVRIINNCNIFNVFSDQSGLIILPLYCGDKIIDYLNRHPKYHESGSKCATLLKTKYFQIVGNKSRVCYVLNCDDDNTVTKGRRVICLSEVKLNLILTSCCINMRVKNVNLSLYKSNSLSKTVLAFPINSSGNKLTTIFRNNSSVAENVRKLESFSDNGIQRGGSPISKLPPVIRTINPGGPEEKVSEKAIYLQPPTARSSIPADLRPLSRTRRSSLERRHLLRYFDEKGVVISQNEEKEDDTNFSQAAGTQKLNDGKNGNSVDSAQSKTHLRHYRGKRRKVGVRVLGVEGASSLLPCDVTSRVPNDVPLLLMWFKEGSHTPLFSVDFREDTLNGGPHVGRDLTSLLTERARLHVTKDSHFYRSEFLKATNHNYTSENYEPFISSGGNMEIKPTKRADEGIYKCRVDFLHSPTSNAKVNLTVIIPPHSLELEWRKNGIWHQPSGDYLEPLIIGEALHIVCKASPAWPPPLVIWSSEGIRIDDTFDQHPQMSLPKKVAKGHKILTGATNHMQIGRLQRTDHLRKLTCKASNSNLVPPTTRTITLSVALPVLAIILDEPPTVDLGQSMNVQCTVRGSFPPPLVKWKLGEEELKASQFRVSEDGNTTFSVVKVTPTVAQNGKPLVCQAYNPILHAHKVPNSLKILKDIKIINVRFAPRVTARLGKSLDGSLIKEGDDVYFECVFEANPEPHIVSWIHNGKKRQNRPGVFQTKDTLVIQGVTIEDSGNYSCVAINTMGQDSSGEVQLKVKFAPICAKYISAQEFSIAKYERAMIFCNVSANPSNVVFRWSFNNTAELVDVPRDRYSSKGSFSVLNYTPMNELDYGTLLCWGSNEVGKQEQPCAFHIRAAGKPEPPHNCHVVQATISSLRVTCLPGSDGGDPQVFHLQVQKVTVGRQVVAEVSNSSPDFFAANLQPSVKYRLLITAANKRGESHPPKELLAMTAELQAQRQETNAEATRERKTHKKDKMRVMMGIGLSGTAAGVTILILTTWACVRLKKRGHNNQSESNNELQRNNSAGTEEDNLGLEEIEKVTKKTDINKDNVVLAECNKSVRVDINPENPEFTIISKETDLSIEDQSDWGKSSNTSPHSKYQYSHKIFTDEPK